MTCDHFIASQHVSVKKPAFTLMDIISMCFNGRIYKMLQHKEANEIITSMT